jgi:hypothetical protein
MTDAPLVTLAYGSRSAAQRNAFSGDFADEKQLAVLA